jgi:protein TonB
MRKYTLLLSVTVHVLAACALIIAPLLAAASLPSIHDVVSFVPVQVVPPPPPPPRSVAPARVARADVAPVPQPPQQPPSVDAPPVIPQETDAPHVSFEGSNRSDPVGRVGGDHSGDGVIGGFGPPVQNVAPPPIPKPPVRVGTGVVPPKKTRDVRPIYPPIAVAAKQEGLVILEAVIGEDGTVRDVKVLRSVALLDQAAIEAVRQWRFTPTLLSGQPVPIVMTVTVDFKLN